MSNKSDFLSKFNSSFEGAAKKAWRSNDMIAFCWFYQVNLSVRVYLLIFFKSQYFFVFIISFCFESQYFFYQIKIFIFTEIF